MDSLPIEAADGHLTEILQQLSPGSEITLTRNEQPVAVLRGLLANGARIPKFGTLAGTIISIAPDFDSIPEGFEDYVP